MARRVSARGSKKRRGRRQGGRAPGTEGGIRVRVLDAEKGIVAVESASGPRAYAEEMAYKDGMRKIGAGDARGALSHFESMAAENPQDPLAFAGLGAAHIMTGSGEEALESIKTAVKLGDGRAETLGDMGTAYRMLGMYDEALECYRQALERRPDSAPLHVNMAHVYGNWEMHEDAIRVSDRALRLDPSLYSANMAKGTALLNVFRYEEAAVLLRKAAGAEPGSYAARQHLGEALSGAGDLEGAVECFEAAARIDPSDALCRWRKGLALTKMGEHARAYEAHAEAAKKGKASYMLADAALALAAEHEGGAPGPWLAKARELADRALEADPGEAGAHLAKAVLLEAEGKDSGKHRAEAARLDPEHGGDSVAEVLDARRRRVSEAMALLGSDPAGAVSRLEKLAGDEPGFAEARMALGAALAASGDREAALAELEKARGAGADEARAYACMADIYEAAGEKKRAQELRLKAESAGSRKASVRLAQERMREGRLDEAARAADLALRRGPDSEASLIKGRALAETGRARESIGPLRDAVNLSPGSPKAHTFLGDSLALVGKTKEALRHYDEAVRLAPAYVRALQGRGDALGQMERFQEAYETYEKVAKLEPLAKTYSNMAAVLLNMSVRDGSAFKDPAGEWRDRALSLVDRAIGMDGKYAYAHLVKSKILRLSGDERGADECVRRAAKIDPSLDPARAEPGRRLAGRLLRALAKKG